MISFKKHSGIYTLSVEQSFPISLSEAWNFFSSPTNLEKITPNYMGFKITSGKPIKIYSGQIISYKVNLLFGLKSNWVTEITQVDEGKLFVDEQRFGPYRMWHHEHHFKEIKERTLMTDIVSYKIPFGIFGRIAQLLFIKKQLKEIFDYRKKVLGELF